MRTVVAQVNAGSVTILGNLSPRTTSFTQTHSQPAMSFVGVDNLVGLAKVVVQFVDEALNGDSPGQS
jgi:hypothetical protein